MIASTVSVRFTGPLSALSVADRSALLDRAASPESRVRERTTAIIRDVRERGDVALRAQVALFDGVALDEIEVPRSARQRALDTLPPELRRAMERSATNIARVHRAWLPTAIECEVEPGVLVGRRPDPLGRVGVYAPGGRAAYPSSVLMGVIPARLAGVSEIILCSPPQADGRPSQSVLAAAELSGVDRVFAIGGAGAIAAMAYGTRTIPRVDRIVGPGNAYVAEAKLQVVGSVAIDAPAGPSEALIITDRRRDATRVAREMLAQAEHDPHACVVTVAIGADVADAIREAVDALAGDQRRRAIIAEALAVNGAVLSVASVDEAIAFANEYAPEHLLLAIDGADGALLRIRNCGTVFLGDGASVVFGDYMTGANHVLPTGGAARSYSGLSTLDFVRWTTYQRISRNAGETLAGDTATFADAEDLPGHATAAQAMRILA